MAWPALGSVLANCLRNTEMKPVAGEGAGAGGRGGGVYFLLCSVAYPSVHSLHLVTLTASKTNGAAYSEYAVEHVLFSEYKKYMY